MCEVFAQSFWNLSDGITRNFKVLKVGEALGGRDDRGFTKKLE